MNLKQKKWKNLEYKKTMDYYLSSIISEKTNFDVYKIVVWYARKDKDIYNYFLFQYRGEYYELYNSKLKKIDKTKVFKRNKLT